MINNLTPIKWQMFEAVFVFVGSILAIHFTHASYWWLALILVPDVFMVGYLQSNSLGAFSYNLGHTFLFPAILIVAGLITTKPIVICLGLVWLAHIGMDRMLGYGLKETKGFKHTHLGTMGKK